MLIDVIHRLKIEEGTGPILFNQLMPYMDCCGRPWRLCKGVFGGAHPIGKLTVGYGFNIDDTGLSERESDFILLDRVDAVIPRLASLLTFWNNLGDARKLVLVDLAYNMGVTKLVTEFRPTINLIAAGKYQEAASHMRGWLWYSQVRKRAEPLVRTMETGEIVEPDR